ncbi:hypothetical protein [Archangium sp.]|uniref:hypothetical protein n=1 Tax=Archangium sp. TaxID=1872627 RepID=UPI003899A910
MGEAVTVASCADGLCAVTVPRLNREGWVPEANLGRTPPTQKQLALRAVSSLEQACALSPGEDCLMALEAAYRVAGESGKAAAVVARRKTRALEEAARHPIRFALNGIASSRPLFRDGERVLALCPEGPRWFPVRVRNRGGEVQTFEPLAPCKPAPAGGPPPLPVYVIAGLPRANVRVGTLTEESPGGITESVARLDGQELRTPGYRGLTGAVWLFEPTRARRMHLGFAPGARFSFAGDLDGDGLLDVIVSFSGDYCGFSETRLLLSSKSTVAPFPAIVARTQEPTECD